MNLLKEENKGYLPIYTRTDITDLLHEKFNFRTDYQIITEKNLKKIANQSKNKKRTHFLLINKISQSLIL